jgi:cold shock CspA family protein
VEVGWVQRFDHDRGFGFIAPEAGGPDIFTHVSGLVPGIDAGVMVHGLRVTFERAHSDKGPKAIRVTPSPERAAEYPEPPEDGPVVPTEAAWRELWDKWSATAFESFLGFAYANGWVMEYPEQGEAYEGHDS